MADAKDVPDASRHDSTAEEAVAPSHGEHMTRAAWLACGALLLVQNASFEPIILASITKAVDDRIGPVNYYNWIMISVTISSTLLYPITGGLSDIFGRRVFLFTGCTVSMAGHILALATNTMPLMITAMTILGIGAGASQLAGACIGEIVPRRYRGYAQTAMDLTVVPWTVFGNLIGMTMIKRHALGYKISFIIGIALNALAMVSVLFWYHPERRPLPYGRTKLQQLGHIDWIGMLLFASGVLLFLVSLSLGGTDVPYDTPGFFVVFLFGILLLSCLFLWEWKGAKEPFFARSLFQGQAKRLPLMFVLIFIAGMTMYSTLALWPQQIQGMYFSDYQKIGIASMSSGLPVALGGAIGGSLVGKTWYLEPRYILAFGSICKIVADVLLSQCTPATFAKAAGATALGSFGMGIVTVASITVVQLLCAEKDLGLASLLLQSVRGAGGATALAIYSNFISNAFKQQIPTLVMPYISDYVPKIKDFIAFIKAMVTGHLDAAGAVPGVEDAAVEITRARLKSVWTYAFRKIYLTSVAFAALAFVLSLFADKVGHLMTQEIAVHMEEDRRPAEKQVTSDP